MTALFALALFSSAALLFWIQLLVSKLLLPVLGGSAAVWNTCMVFFQTGLLAGYLYSDLTTRWLRPRLQALLHLTLLALAALVLPVALRAGEAPPPGENPIPWLLGTLTLIVGPPFVAIAASAPMLQAWYARSGARGAGDPYFLYAASNLGSLLSLLAYPTVIEPRLRLAAQGWWWTAGYLALIALTAGAAAWSLGRAGASEPAPLPAPESPGARVTWGLRLRWVLLPLVPSSLLLGVTNYLTTDIAAAPLFWVVPLALYLLSYVLAFQRTIPMPIPGIAAAQPFLLLPMAFLLLWGEQSDAALVFAVHLAAFFATALLCHRELAAARPETGKLTEYYLLISVGGALGGVFNALVAPLVFDRVLEYPLALIAACLLRPGALPSLARWLAGLGDLVLPGLLLLFLLALPRHMSVDFSGLSDNATVIVVAVTALAAYGFRQRPLRFALGFGAILVAGSLLPGSSEPLLRSRNFYGVLTVRDWGSPPVRILYHGTTTHGEQSRDPERVLQPISYYHPTGPLGQIFAAVGGTPRTERVAAIGLGTGTLACYAHEGEDWTFYEINSEVVRISEDLHLFTFIRDCPARPRIVLGDARLSIGREPDRRYTMMIFDAFNSDAIPIHLITRDAVALYLTKLDRGGYLVFHISNRYLDLHPVLANIAADLGLAVLSRSDDERIEGDDEDTDEKDRSDWVVMARTKEDLAPLAGIEDWTTLETDPRVGVWSDDYANLLGALRSDFLP
ncbi:MAG TPA: hypothetical protein VMU06_18925 [Stellaceae bacterium]|nr:hypothetical protein [Stellaceae bacterium]